MNQKNRFSTRADQQHPPRSIFHPGDLLLPRVGYPLLCEVVTVEARGVLRIRGVEWDPGYSAEVPAEEMRPVSSILTGA